ncbi:hypothetical protein [Halobiforma nitratireducens]|uniref:hypothetical protein n=1 Tax=Halobiforma nitratireducens TaxID=130048 RepID=UPI0006782236|nr:hypothetical protein [Halobiforma nitratireducens]
MSGRSAGGPPLDRGIRNCRLPRDGTNSDSDSVSGTGDGDIDTVERDAPERLTVLEGVDVPEPVAVSSETPLCRDGSSSTT